MNKIAADHLARRACVYIRQSTPDQVQHNILDPCIRWYPGEELFTEDEQVITI